MIEITVITSELQTPADAVSVTRAEAAAMMISDDYSLTILQSGSTEAKQMCPEAISEDDAYELFGTDEDRQLMSIWQRRRNEEYQSLPVRLSSIWNDEYDRLTEPVRDAVEKYGRIMTPVVLINGSILCSGRAAKPCELEKCMKETAEN